MCRFMNCALVIVTSAGVTALGLADRAKAEVIPIDNASFELPVLADGTWWRPSDIPGWGSNRQDALIWVNVVFNPDSSSTPDGEAPDGENCLALQNAEVFQFLLSAALEANTSYRLLVDVTDRLDQNLIDYWIQFGVSGPVTLAEDHYLLGGDISNGETVTSETFYTTQPGDPIGAIIFVRLRTYDVPERSQTLYDNVRLDKTCVGDGDFDGTVGINDFLALLKQWGDGPGPYDFNNDGLVGINDFLELLASWGPCP